MSNDTHEEPNSKAIEASGLVRSYLESVIEQALAAPETKANVDYILAAYDAIHVKTVVKNDIAVTVDVSNERVEEPVRWNALKNWEKKVLL